MECLVNGDLPSHGMQAKVNLLLGDLTAIGLKQIVECDQVSKQTTTLKYQYTSITINTAKMRFNMLAQLDRY